jgi:hypothetical protein
VEGKPVAFTFNLAEVMNRTSLKANEPLLPGDTVFVERKRKSNSWRDTLSAVVSIFSLVSLTRNL